MKLREPLRDPPTLFVAPFTGAWIETWMTRHPRGFRMPSLPSRERGLKQWTGQGTARQGHVAPFTGAWIETADPPDYGLSFWVAPFTGAWIETSC